MVSRRDLLAAGAAIAATRQTQARSARAQPPALRTLRVCFQTAETGFDPAQTQDYYSNTIISHIFDAPLRYDFLARPVKLIPNTAASMPHVSEDFRTFTVRLTPGIFFQDDAAFGGKQRELIAADYVYSIKRVFDPRWKSQVLFILEAAKISGIDRLRQRALKDKQPFNYAQEIDGLQVLDRYTFQIRLEQPNPRFAYTLSLANPLGAVAREVVEAYGDQIMAHPVGTGPFRLAQWKRTSRIVLERNPTYRQEIYDFAAPDSTGSIGARRRKIARAARAAGRPRRGHDHRGSAAALAVVRPGGARSPAGADRIRNTGRAERKAGAEPGAARGAS